MNKQITSLLVFFLAVIAVFTFRPLEPDNTNTLLEQALYCLASLMASASAFLAFRTYGRGPRFGSLLALSLGLLSWFIADVQFYYYEFILNDLPYPSPADYFFLAGYILMLTGLAREVFLSDISWKKMSKKVYLVSGAFTVIILTVFTYLTVFSAYSPDAPFAENLVTIGYTVGDLLLVIAGFFILLATWEYRGGKASKVWLALFLGYFATLSGDLMYSIFPEELFSHQGIIYEISQYLYILGYLFMTYAFITLQKTLKTFQTIPVLKTSSQLTKSPKNS